MFSELALFAANRATQGAVGNVTRRVSWGAIAALFLACGVIFGSIAIYVALEPVLGNFGAAAAVAGGAVLVALICFSAPALFEAMEKRAAARAQKTAHPIAETVAAVSKETEAAVDYFGPLQVVASAFLIGLRTGKTVRGLGHGSGHAGPTSAS